MKYFLKIFSKKVILNEEVRSYLRVATDIVSSWKVEKEWAIGLGTDMKDIAKRDLKYLEKKYPKINFTLFEDKKNYYGIKFKHNEDNINHILKIGYN